MVFERRFRAEVLANLPILLKMVAGARLRFASLTSIRGLSGSNHYSQTGKGLVISDYLPLLDCVCQELE
jgi:hypothetical protein